MPLRDPAWRNEITNGSSAGQCFRFWKRLPDVTQNRPVLRMRNIFHHTDGDCTGTGNLRLLAARPIEIDFRCVSQSGWLQKLLEGRFPNY